MSSALVIGIGIGLWFLVCLVVIAACWAAHLGDEDLLMERADRGARPSPRRAISPSHRATPHSRGLMRRARTR